MSKRMRSFTGTWCVAVVLLGAWLLSQSCGGETTTERPAAGPLSDAAERLVDWGTEVRRDPWDMAQKEDVASAANVAQLSFKSGVVRFVSQDDPQLNLDLGGRTIESSYDVLALRMWLSQRDSGHVYYWSPDGDWQGFALPPLGEGWRTYYVDMTTARAFRAGGGSEQRQQWGGASGQISKLRLDPVSNAGIHVGIDWISLLRGADVATRERIRELTPDPHYDHFGNITRRSFPPVSLSLLRQPLLTFVVIADTHLGMTGEEAYHCHPVRVREAMRQINQLKPAFVMHCGDIVTSFPGLSGYEERLDSAAKLLRQWLEPPVYFVPGNHDVGDKRTLPEREGHVQVREDFVSSYRERFGPDYHSFNHAGCHLVCLNSQILSSGLPSEDRQWAWLEEDLQTAQKARYIFMFLHSILFWADLGDPGPGNYFTINEPARSRVLKLCRDYGVKVVYAGHTHWAFSTRYGDTEFHALYSTTFTNPFFHTRLSAHPTGAGVFNPFKVGYYVVRVYPDEVTSQFVQSYPRIQMLQQLQGGNPNPGFRILPRDAAEVEDSPFGVVAPIPTTTWLDEPAMPCIIDQQVTLPRQAGLKWLRATGPPLAGDGGNDLASDLMRLTTLGSAWGINLVVPVAVTRFHVVPREFTGKVAAWEVGGWGEGAGEAVRALHLERLREVSRKVRGSDPEAKLVLGDLSLSQVVSLAGSQLSEILHYADAVLLGVDLSLVKEDEYVRLIAVAKEKVRAAHPTAEVWAHLTASVGERTRAERARQLARLLLLNVRQGVRTFTDAVGAHCGLLDEELDPTELYYVTMTFSTIFDVQARPVPQSESDVRTTGRGVEKILFRDGNGALWVALWVAAERGAEARETRTDLAIEGDDPSHLLLVDPLTATLQEPLWGSSEGEIIVPGLLVRDYPLFVRLGK